jgi:hypothetical protein
MYWMLLRINNKMQIACAVRNKGNNNCCYDNNDNNDGVEEETGETRIEKPNNGYVIGMPGLI